MELISEVLTLLCVVAIGGYIDSRHSAIWNLLLWTTPVIRAAKTESVAIVLLVVMFQLCLLVHKSISGTVGLHFDVKDNTINVNVHEFEEDNDEEEEDPDSDSDDESDEEEVAPKSNDAGSCSKPESPRPSGECPLKFELCSKLNSECPLKSLGECPKPVGECPLKSLGECPKPVGECPLKSLGECPKPVGECPKTSDECSMDEPSKPEDECPLKSLGECPKPVGECPLRSLDKCPKPDGECSKTSDECSMDEPSKPEDECPHEHDENSDCKTKECCDFCPEKKPTVLENTKYHGIFTKTFDTIYDTLVRDIAEWFEQIHSKNNCDYKPDVTKIRAMAYKLGNLMVESEMASDAPLKVSSLLKEYTNQLECNCKFAVVMAC